MAVEALQSVPAVPPGGAIQGAVSSTDRRFADLLRLLFEPGPESEAPSETPAPALDAASLNLNTALSRALQGRQGAHFNLLRSLCAEPVLPQREAAPENTGALAAAQMLLQMIDAGR